MDPAAIKLAPALYVVGTPIGNLEDITLRALRVLRSCYLVAAEDTRHTRKLLNHFEVTAKSISYREENHETATLEIIATIQAAQPVALVSDAGMPGISDPGAPLVNACVAAGLAVEIIPGVSAVTTVASRSGMTSRGFSFAGFPPARQKARREFLQTHSSGPLPVIYFEAPHRLTDCLEDMKEILGQRQLVLGRELTKIHEEWISGSIDEVLVQLGESGAPRGEFSMIVAPPESEGEQDFSETELKTLYAKLLDSGLHPRDALKALVVQTELPRKYLYNLLRKDES